MCPALPKMLLPSPTGHQLQGYWCYSNVRRHLGISNHRRFDCLSTNLFRLRTWEILVWHYLLFVRKIHQSPTGGFPSRRASNAESLSMSERHHSNIETLQRRHNDHNGVSNHQPHGCLLNRLFRRRSKKTSKLRVTGLCVENSPGPGNSPHKGPVTRKMFPFDDVIMKFLVPPRGEVKRSKARDLLVNSGLSLSP